MRTSSLSHHRADRADHVPIAQQNPLRVLIRSGPKSHGPGAHDYPRFLKEWVPLLNAHGARATGAEGFPTKAQLDDTDVLILHSQEAGNIQDPAERKNLAEFLARGGGLVTIHAGSVSRDPDWFRTIAGGSWRNGTTRWLEGPMHLYFTDRESAITKDMSNWAMDDEIYYDMDLMPDVRVLAAAYTPKAAGARNAGAQRRADELTGGGKRVSVYDIQPQIWTYERTIEGGRAPYRSFVSIPGHLYENFNRPNYRALLLRGIAWAGKRPNVDELLEADENGDALRYVEGGPTAPLEGRREDRGAPRVRSHAGRRRAADPQGHEHRLGRKGPALGLGDAGVSQRPPRAQHRAVEGHAARSRRPQTARSGRHHLDPHRHQRRRHDGSQARVRRQAGARHRLRLPQERRHRRRPRRTSGTSKTPTATRSPTSARKLYTGLGIADTHAVINNLRWGLDGWIYATHGYSVGMVTCPDGKKEFGRDGSGVVRFKPDGSAFEQYSSRGGNTWGLDITWDGQVFWTQPTSGTVFFHTVLPEAVLAKGGCRLRPRARG